MHIPTNAVHHHVNAVLAHLLPCHEEWLLDEKIEERERKTEGLAP
jgi:hypothetical protein